MSKLGLLKWRPNRKITFNRWEDCPRCGLSWPEKALKREVETGSVVCPECFDDPSYAYKKSQSTLKENIARRSAPWDPE